MGLVHTAKMSGVEATSPRVILGRVELSFAALASPERCGLVGGVHRRAAERRKECGGGGSSWVRMEMERKSRGRARQ